MKSLTSVWEKTKQLLNEREQADQKLHLVVEDFFQKELGLASRELIQGCSLKQGKLVLRLNNKALAQELAWRKEDLLTQLKQAGVMVTNLVIGWVDCQSYFAPPSPNY